MVKRTSRPATLDSATARLLACPCLYGSLRKAVRGVTRVYEEEFRSVGFTGSTQYTVLRSLNAADGIRQRDLGMKMGIDETTLTRTLRPLIEKGWIMIAAGSDRREKLLTLSDPGRQQLLKALPAWERAQSRIKKVIPSDNWDALMDLLPPSPTRAATREVFLAK